MVDIDTFYNETLGKESSLFVGTLWLGMIAKHMDEVRKAEDDAWTTMDGLVWMKKLRTLYDNVEFKTNVPHYKDDVEFTEIVIENGKVLSRKIQLKHPELFIRWFKKIEGMWERVNKIPRTSETSQVLLNNHKIVLDEISECQRALYREIEKKHLIMPPEREDMKELTKRKWIDRESNKEF